MSSPMTAASTIGSSTNCACRAVDWHSRSADSQPGWRADPGAAAQPARRSMCWGVRRRVVVAVLAPRMLLGAPVFWYAPCRWRRRAAFGTLLVFGLARSGELAARASAADRDRGRRRLVGTDQLRPEHQPGRPVAGMLFWLMGDLADADRPGLPFIVLAAFVSTSRARDLNIATQGCCRRPRSALNTDRLRPSCTSSVPC